MSAGSAGPKDRCPEGTPGHPTNCWARRAPTEYTTALAGAVDCPVSRAMPDSLPEGSSPAGGSKGLPRSSVAERLAQFEERQKQLWRITYFLLRLLTVAYVIVSWETIRSFAKRYEFLLPALVLGVF